MNKKDNSGSPDKEERKWFAIDTTLSDIADGARFSDDDFDERFADFDKNSFACTCTCTCTIEKMQMA